ncbi:MAG: DNA methyltransferase, partial [Okeania sp. SIO3C4]|nr:DNA methyltransferase [Okeania sp. SIO3C4]
EWVYDFNEKNLKNKIQFFIKKYNELLKNKDTSWNTEIKWSRDLKKKFTQSKKIKYSKSLITHANYRPFCKRLFYSEKILNDILTQNHTTIFGENLDKKNIGICINKNEADDRLLATDKIYDLHFTGDAVCIPLYRYTKTGEKINNITTWGIEQFRSQYNDTNIEGNDIFNYVYAVLHNPAYRQKYQLNLKREYPRIPFYNEFWKWANWGKELIDLHVDYETVEPYKLKIIEEKNTQQPPKTKLKALPENGEIIVDENTLLTEIPELAWQYKLGNRSALHWILDQYKEKNYTETVLNKYPDKRILAENYNLYKFSDYKKNFIDLIKKITSVSIRTMEIINQMETEELKKE